jgi:ABC-type phosphate transport system substrate-binding protein
MAASDLSAEVVAVVHSDCSEDMLNTIDIKQIYLGKKSTWSDSTRITLYYHGDLGITEEFLKLYVGKTPAQFDIYWKKMVFTGKGSMPVKKNNDKAMIQAISEKKGAIGFIDKDRVTEAVGIKVLTIE